MQGTLSVWLPDIKNNVRFLICSTEYLSEYVHCFLNTFFKFSNMQEQSDFLQPIKPQQYKKQEKEDKGVRIIIIIIIIQRKIKETVKTTVLIVIVWFYMTNLSLTNLDHCT